MLNLKMIHTVTPHELMSFVQNQHYPNYAILSQAARIRHIKRQVDIIPCHSRLWSMFSLQRPLRSLSHVFPRSERGLFQDAEYEEY